MSLLIDKTGHFVGIQHNREDRPRINPHHFLRHAPASAFRNSFHITAVLVTMNLRVASKLARLASWPALSFIFIASIFAAAAGILELYSITIGG